MAGVESRLTRLEREAGSDDGARVEFIVAAGPPVTREQRRRTAARSRRRVSCASQSTWTARGAPMNSLARRVRRLEDAAGGRAATRARAGPLLNQCQRLLPPRIVERRVEKFMARPSAPAGLPIRTFVGREVEGVNQPRLVQQHKVIRHLLGV